MAVDPDGGRAIACLAIASHDTIETQAVCHLLLLHQRSELALKFERRALLWCQEQSTE